MTRRKKERGRPRSPEVDLGILRAAMRVMARKGYAGMTIDEVAAEARVSRPTIYLRYPGKAELATAALAAYRARGRPDETGDTRADLISRLRHFRKGIERPFGMAMLGSVLTEEHSTPELLALWRERLVKPRRAELREVLEHARARGELREGGDVEAAVNMLVGSYYAQYLAGNPFPDDWPEAVVDTILAGLGQPGP
ncbi:MAG: TetR/AcrR family transcriptional regulator [Actinobacteria bacterium]|nr:TetR/AcrR family transcriptional regulator [Actinomycetota bacterium]